MSLLQNSNAIEETGGYTISNSLRFRRSASAYLSRTPASAGNRQIMTLSFWVKKSAVDATAYVLFGTSSCWIRFRSDYTLQFSWDGTNYVQPSTRLFRDPSSWYHIIIALDTTQSSIDDKIKIYINGELQTNTLGGIALATNTNLGWNNAANHNLGNSPGSTNYYDGYMAEVNFIDGQSLDSSYFGQTDTTTGVWKPKAYSGTYGTNGFYLKFSDIATTSGSNAGLGKDFSSNSNYWTTNNISVTADSTYDAMTDSPTLSASASNYATLDPNAKASSITLSDGNLKSVDASGSFTVCVFATQTVSNKCYWEFQITNVGVNNARGACGVLPSNYTPTTLANDTLVAGVTALGANSVGMCPQVSAIYQNGATTGISTGVWVANDIVMMAYDNGKLWMGRNGTWANSGNPAAGTGEVASGLDTSALPVICNRNSQTWIANFGQRPFAYTPPTGFVGLNTYNLPDSTIKKGNSYMDATLWTGDGSAQTITNAGAFKPDLVWWKNRNSTRNNLVFDSIRGVGNYIQTNATTAEATDAQMLTSFNSDGFTHGTSANGATSAETYVAWQWNASTAVTPTYKTSQLSTQATNSTTISVTVPTYTTGDLLVMVVNSGGSSATTWTTPSGWTAGPNNGTAQAVFWRIAVSEPASYTVTQSTSNTADGTILVFSNASFDTAGAPAGNSTTITPSAITVANNNSTILYVVYDSAASRSPTAAPTGYTTIISDGDATSPCQFVYRLSGVASGSYTGPTVTTSGNMRCFTIAIKPSSAVLNTTGSITSTVSANTTAGFSIVTYTGTGANATVGHGLGVAPKLVIIKDRTNGTNDWPFYHTSGGPLNILYLNSTSAYITVGAAGVWNSTAPSSTVFSIGTNGRINTSSNNYVAYCWAEIEGFSKFGSYTGNGSANGPVVYLGFRPKYLMIKQTNTTANWHLIDSSRNLYNVVDLGLKANLTDAESAGSSTLTPYIDFLANGFKLRTSQNQTNASGGNFIYVAFAENPFKNSLAR